MEGLAGYKWAVLMLGVLALLVWELRRTKRDIRRAQDEERKRGE